ncbi:MAG: hypothetical protein IKU24_01360 [Clostridia bacterium]|nr:hypothetical protein [Clostridia bacterium]
MYSGTLRKQSFEPDSSTFQYAKEREMYIKQLKEKDFAPPPVVFEEKNDPPLLKEEKSLASLLEMVSPEDSALIALIVFLLCDNTENDVVLLGILLYVLLSK